MNLNETLKMLREERGVCQKELALYLNVSIGTISNYENGIHSPDLESLCRLADFYDVSADYLLGRTSYRGGLAALRQPIYKAYTLETFLELLSVLSEKDRYVLTYFLKLLPP